MASKEFCLLHVGKEAAKLSEHSGGCKYKKEALGVAASLPLSVPMFLHLQNQKGKIIDSFQQNNPAIWGSDRLQEE